MVGVTSCLSTPPPPRSCLQVAFKRAFHRMLSRPSHRGPLLGYKGTAQPHERPNTTNCAPAHARTEKKRLTSATANRWLPHCRGCGESCTCPGTSCRPRYEARRRHQTTGSPPSPRALWACPCWGSSRCFWLPLTSYLSSASCMTSSPDVIELDPFERQLL